MLYGWVVEANEGTRHRQVCWISPEGHEVWCDLSVHESATEQPTSITSPCRCVGQVKRFMGDNGVRAFARSPVPRPNAFLLDLLSKGRGSGRCRRE